MRPRPPTAASAPFTIAHEANRRLMAEYVDDEAVADEAARCPVPALFLHGSEDPRPADGARSLAGIVPHARFTSVAGAGHLPWVEHPDVVHREIVDFLSAKP